MFCNSIVVGRVGVGRGTPLPPRRALGERTNFSRRRQKLIVRYQLVNKLHTRKGNKSY